MGDGGGKGAAGALLAAAAAANAPDVPPDLLPALPTRPEFAPEVFLGTFHKVQQLTHLAMHQKLCSPMSVVAGAQLHFYSRPAWQHAWGAPGCYTRQQPEMLHHPACVLWCSITRAVLCWETGS